MQSSRPNPPNASISSNPSSSIDSSSGGAATTNPGNRPISQLSQHSQHKPIHGSHVATHGGGGGSFKFPKPFKPQISSNAMPASPTSISPTSNNNVSGGGGVGGLDGASIHPSFNSSFNSKSPSPQPPVIILDGIRYDAISVSNLLQKLQHYELKMFDLNSKLKQKDEIIHDLNRRVNKLSSVLDQTALKICNREESYGDGLLTRVGSGGGSDKSAGNGTIASASSQGAEGVGGDTFTTSSSSSAADMTNLQTAQLSGNDISKIGGGLTSSITSNNNNSFTSSSAQPGGYLGVSTTTAATHLTVMGSVMAGTAAADEAIRLKKQGISAESGMNEKSIELKYHEKDQNSILAIRQAIRENDFLNMLEPIQIKEITQCMYENNVVGGSFIIKEGDVGQHLYVLASGRLQVSKQNKILGEIEPYKTFGELALLYNCKRTASVKALTNVKYWALDQKVFQTIMKKTNIQRQEENLRFLQSVTALKDLSPTKMNKIADCLELDIYQSGQCIIREGEIGQTFYVIKSGTVKVMQLVEGKNDPQEIRTLQTGDFFGEKALLSDEIRTADVIATSSTVEVLVLDRSNFINLIGDLDQLQMKDYGDEQRKARNILRKNQLIESQCSSNSHNERLRHEFSCITIEDLEFVGTLGVGGFGRVELVKWKKDPTKSFALKCLKKRYIIETRQQEHIYFEKDILLECNSPQICKLYRTYKDTKFVYMLLEVCLGGEVWTILRNRKTFDSIMTQFVVANVIEALSYLHDRGIIYRDLKPENLLLDSKGFVKLCDFGFAKKIGKEKKTWTFCGTPEYVAPEIILNKGHDFSADFWSVGILMFELLTGTPPFTGNEPMKIYNQILKGIDKLIFNPQLINRMSQNLILKFCKESPTERLGYGKGGISDIKKQKFFQGFDWSGLVTATIIPPILPNVSACDDLRNFDSFPIETEIALPETSGWDENF